MAAPVNTINSELQLVEVLDMVMRAFKRRILPVLAFSTVFRNVQLQGTDKVAVPYYPLFTDGATDFDKDQGYQFTGSNGTNVRDVTINRRKYMNLALTSSDFRRQPQLRPDQLMTLRAEKLAEDVIADIFSIVTAANYGASIKEVSSASFNSDDLIDIRGTCNGAMWPKTGRSIILDTEYDNALFKDGDVKLTYAIGSDKTIREGDIGRLLGFDYYDSPVFPENGERLVGIAAFASAMLVAFSPVEPHPDVAAKLTRYEMMTDKDTGLTLEFRQWGDPDMDTSKRVIEVNYGYNKGEAAALKRITRPA